jgi:hypothetical protein
MAIQKVDSRAGWAARNPLLLSGEIGLEKETGNQKIGNGRQQWNDLQYFGSPGYWAEFSSDADQTTTADTPTEITFNKANEHNHGVKVISNSRLTVEYPGVYVFEVMLQLQNDDTQIHDAHFWLRKNNAGDSGNLALTGSAASVIEKHGGVPGANNLLLDHTLKLAAEDYIQIMWAPSNANISLKTGAAVSSPYVRPSRPSVVCNVFQIAGA